MDGTTTGVGSIFLFILVGGGVVFGVSEGVLTTGSGAPITDGLIGSGVIFGAVTLGNGATSFLSGKRKYAVPATTTKIITAKTDKNILFIKRFKDTITSLY